MQNHYNTRLVIPKNTILAFILLSFIFIYPESLGGIYIYIPMFIVGLVALNAMIKIPMNIQARYFFVFALYMMGMSLFFSFINGNDLFVTIRSTIRLFYPFLAIVVGGFFRKKISDKTLLYILLTVLLIEFVVSLLQFNNTGFREWSYSLYRSENTVDKYLENFNYSTGRRAIGTLNNPNTLGLAFIVLNSSIIILSDLLKEKRIKRTIGIIATLATIYVIVNTQSRTSILIYVFVIGLIFYWKFSKRSRNNVIFLVISSIAAAFLLLFIQSKTSREINISALDSRFNIWDIRISQMLDYVEYESFFAYILGGGFQMARSFGFFDNTYLKVFVSGGIIGLFMFFMVISKMFKGIRKISRVEYRHLAWVLFFTWIIGSMVVEYQEIFKLSTITFILIGYTLYSDLRNNNSAVCTLKNNNFVGDKT